MWQVLRAAGGQPAGLRAYHQLRVEAGTPVYGVDIDETNLPQEVARTDDASLARILSENLRAGRTMKYYADLEKMILGANTTQVDAAFRKYVDPKKMAIFEAGDFSGKTGESKASKAGSAPQ